MSKQYFHCQIKYDDSSGSLVIEDLYVYENNSTDYRSVLDKDGKAPYCLGTDSYCDALGAVLRLEVPGTEEVAFTELPVAVQKSIDIEMYRELNPLKFKEYPENLEVIREKPIEGWTESDWLHHGNAPWDLITEYTDNPDEEMQGISPGKRENGRYIKDMWEACPVCGSKDREFSRYNNLCPSALAGSAGYYIICRDCGYAHQVIEMIS
jgi:rubredoxin